MPFAYAFKNAFEAAHHEGPLAAAFALEVAKVTGGRYSHVECWIDGPREGAVCFSSREPDGTSIKTIDLSDSALWTIVPIPTTEIQDATIRGFCMGSSGRRYDGLGILGIGTDTGLHDPFDRFCSESSFEVGQACLNLLRTLRVRWMVAPSGPVVMSGRAGLYEMLIEAGYKPL